MLAKELTEEHVGKNFRLEETSVVVRVDDFVIGEDVTLIMEQYPNSKIKYPWRVPSQSEIEEI